MGFKVGDKVLIKAKDSLTSKLHNGQICTIENILDHCATLVEELPRNDINSKGGVWLYELELVSSASDFSKAVSQGLFTKPDLRPIETNKDYWIDLDYEDYECWRK